MLIHGPFNTYKPTWNYWFNSWNIIPEGDIDTVEPDVDAEVCVDLVPGEGPVGGGDVRLRAVPTSSVLSNYEQSELKP